MVLAGAKERPAIHDMTTQTVVLERKKEDRYELGKEIGRGGLGRVVLALDADLMGRPVAMKLLHPDLARRRESTPSAPPRERFLEEAQVTAHLSHPNIVVVHELGTRPGGELYYTMPFWGGRTLKEEIGRAHALRVREGEGSEAWAMARMRLLSAFADLANAIAFAHSRGVIHRDIKPQNVMRGEFGETVVIDWGLAKVVAAPGGPGGPGGEDAEATPPSQSDRRIEEMIRSLREEGGYRTIDGTAMGTPAYMSPEQAAGKVAEMDERSDIYSLGAVRALILHLRSTGVPHNSVVRPPRSAN